MTDITKEDLNNAYRVLRFLEKRSSEILKEVLPTASVNEAVPTAHGEALVHYDEDFIGGDTIIIPFDVICGTMSVESWYAPRRLKEEIDAITSTIYVLRARRDLLVSNIKEVSGIDTKIKELEDRLLDIHGLSRHL
jgi:hypothetical protein